MVSIRPPQAAGTFYPKDSAQLKELLNTLLKNAPRLQLNGELKALVVPHGAYEYSGNVAAASYHLLNTLDRAQGWEVILVGASHHTPFQGAATTNVEAFQTPLGRCALSQRMREKLGDYVIEYPTLHEQEHIIEVQLPFLQYLLPQLEIFPIITGTITPNHLATILSRGLQKNTLLVITSDLSYYENEKEAREMDARTISAIQEGAPLSQAQACGAVALQALMAIAKTRGWDSHVLGYDTSSKSASKEHVVGYVALAYLKSMQKSQKPSTKINATIKDPLEKVHSSQKRQERATTPTTPTPESPTTHSKETQDENVDSSLDDIAALFR